jgi:hypothetical protein
MPGTKIVVQTLLFPTKKIDWFRDRQSGLTASDIIPKTLASLNISGKRQVFQ